MILFTPPTTATRTRQRPTSDSLRQPLNAAGVATRLSLASGSESPFNFFSTSSHCDYHLALSLARSWIFPQKSVPSKPLLTTKPYGAPQTKVNKGGRPPKTPPTNTPPALWSHPEGNVPQYLPRVLDPSRFWIFPQECRNLPHHNPFGLPSPTTHHERRSTKADVLQITILVTDLRLRSIMTAHAYSPSALTLLVSLRATAVSSCVTSDNDRSSFAPAHHFPTSPSIYTPPRGHAAFILAAGEHTCSQSCFVDVGQFEAVGLDPALEHGDRLRARPLTLRYGDLPFNRGAMKELLNTWASSDTTSGRWLPYYRKTFTDIHSFPPATACSRWLSTPSTELLETMFALSAA
ncbi:hypothetical protein L202_05179 [Cryptococcus amylolentus CBS 6039]|uniref:Uncharacterized protein n=2 Tax=Cryptococcus amylolentus TaxID=104669 RepID=A0A1E3HJI5_9TREE|nr:hypothetical protein L202_05179 [Cryptococcus amylolentus CBS 6039]ODN76512.1 hypothetical protein L202_05179 [Cryptococcus amylolentus CBS 6039]ODO04504.1 hypothetical protein I350_05108 [Cryptococcus amylolentus CBS 6273]